jgi:RNA polymerase sigma-70 factor, ECF subfamily
VDFFAFDKVYVERLRNGDPATEHHFFVYFEKLLNIKLRSRRVSFDKIEDLKQDTFVRVIAAVRKEGGVRQPERFGAFVNSICNNVLLEY